MLDTFALTSADVLVSPLSVLPRFLDLSSGQVADLYLTVRRVAAGLNAHYNAPGLTISLQDGDVAGQSVPVGFCIIHYSLSFIFSYNLNIIFFSFASL
ncbi:unnamed protein product [Protopolystoma xenopodis]|uniref:HIT domain-containing protein n=1 Tax=Protopolystoma xenopodis TaxID=117903 RepID=A0A448WKV2_9PLAT|nr:unnamed protein product [Protopolystoma xenopodis]